MSWKVREAEESDVANIAAILHQIDWLDFLTELPLEQMLERVTLRLKQCQQSEAHSVWVAEADDGRVAGYANVHWLPYLMLPGKDGFVSELFVREEFRGQGVGTALLERAQQAGKEKGCFRLHLINGKNSKAYEKGFYSGLGWRERDDISNFILPLG